MRDPARIRHLLGLIEEIWTKCPDLRLGQLIVNTATAELGHDPLRSEIFYIEDDVLIRHFEAMSAPVTRREV